MPTCFFAPDWGTALRVAGLLDSEFGNVRVVGGFQVALFHGTVFAVTSDRFPVKWDRLVLSIDEACLPPGQTGRLALEDREEVIVAVALAVNRAEKAGKITT